MLWTQIVFYVAAYFGLFTAIFFLLSYFSRKDEIIDPIPKHFPFVSVIVPAYNEEKTVVKTIKSLVALNYPKHKYEIIVVDDGSIDSTYNKVVDFMRNIKTPKIRIFRKENKGKANAVNFGIRKSKAEFVVCLDADSFVSKDALKKMIGYFEDKEVMAVTPALSVYKPKGFWLNLQWAEFMFGIFLRKVFGLNEAIHVIPGPFSVCRKSFFEKHGYLNENNVTEDTELAMRIQSRGYKIKNSISSLVYANQPNNFNGILKQRLRWYYGFTKNSCNYKELFPPRRWDNLGLLVLPAAFISIIVAVAILFVFLYQNFSVLGDYFTRLLVTGFDIFPSLTNLKLNYIKELLYNYAITPLVAFALLGIILSFVMIALAKYKSKEKKSIVTAYLFFILTYWFFFAFWWLATFFYKGVLGKKIKWGNKFY